VGAVPLSAPPPHPHPPPAAPPPPPPPRPPRVAVQRAHTQPTHAHASGTDVDRDNGQGRHGHRAESHSVLSTAGPIIGTLRLTAPVAARLVSCFTIHSPTSLKPTAPSSTGTSPQPSSAVMCCAGGLLRQRQRHRYAGQAHRHTGRQAGRQDPPPRARPRRPAPPHPSVVAAAAHTATQAAHSVSCLSQSAELRWRAPLGDSSSEFTQGSVAVGVLARLVQCAHMMMTSMRGA
jgi:hypothetical protein